VHVALLTNTTWVKRFLNGKEVAVATVDAPAPAAAPAKK
jgi:hypothetical protein